MAGSAATEAVDLIPWLGWLPDVAGSVGAATDPRTEELVQAHGSSRQDGWH